MLKTASSMKLIRFSDSKKELYGILDGDRVICLPILAVKMKESFPSCLESFILEGSDDASVKGLLQRATREDVKRATFQLGKLKVLAPIEKPPKIVCLGLNYIDHAQEQGRCPPDEPIIFLKPRTTIVGPEENIVKPSFVKQLDYEAELVVVIGREVKNATIKEAESSIFGYTILNDVSARDVQFKDKQWTRGKSFDTFAPMGPCIATANGIENPTNLTIRTWVNGELRQNSTTSNMVLNVFEIVRSLSDVMTLEPCDIISTGTPAGVGFAIKPKPKFLQEDDLVEIEIEGIGILKNRVVEDSNRRNR